jgi:hypothetical protein
MPRGPLAPRNSAIALRVSRFFGIEFGLIFAPSIQLAAATDVPPSAKNSASIAK